MPELIQELKLKLIETLNFEDIRPEDINSSEPLVGGTLELDSIDILELVIMVEKDYGIKINTQELGAQVFASLEALADYIRAQRAQTATVV